MPVMRRRPKHSRRAQRLQQQESAALVFLPRSERRRRAMSPQYRGRSGKNTPIAVHALRHCAATFSTDACRANDLLRARGERVRRMELQTRRIALPFLRRP
jgi:hypothetical protein